MKVVLPDSSELELPDGATGLEAARAIGPKLAEQAVLARVDGDDARPAAPARRRRADPDPDDARHGRPGRALRAPPLDRASARRGGHASPPGREDRDRPADRGRLLLRLRVPRADLARPTWRRSRRRSAARSRRGASGRARSSRATRRRAASRPRASRTRSSSPTTAEGAISLYTQGDFTDLCRGPHLQNSSPIKAVKLTSLAGAYWRGDEHNTQLTRIYGTAFYSQADLDAHLERLEQARARDHRRLGRAARPLPLSTSTRPGSPFWHPKGMVIWNELEDLRRRENARRGYVEVKTPLIYDIRRSGSPPATGRSSGRTCSSIPRDGEEPTRAQADELPGAHAPVRLAASQLPRPADPLRGGVDAPPQRARRDAARAPARAARHAGRRAHLLHARSRSRTRSTAASTTSRYLYDLFGRDAARRALDAPGEASSARDEQWDHAEGGARGRARAARASSTSIGAGRGHVLRAEDRPPHDGRARPELADGDDPARLPDARAVRAHVHGRRTTASTRRSSIHRALLGSLERFIGHPRSSTTAARSPSGSRRCRCA